MADKTNGVKEELAIVAERLNGMQKWMKDVHTELKLVKDQVMITNGRVSKNEQEIALIKQAALIRKEFEEKIKEFDGKKPSVMDKLELIPRRKLIPIIVIIAIVVFMVLDKVIEEGVHLVFNVFRILFNL